MSEHRPWGRAFVWLAILGPFFFASYGLANWLSSRHEHVNAIAFAWERAIPFVPWTIVPYWSIDLLYVTSIFVCASREELDMHAARLIAIQITAVAFFIAFPLQFSFDRPTVDGLSGALFTILGSFDKPYNQAPSLHIALLVVIWMRLSRHWPQWRFVLHAWMIVIALSVLTTYQHHFIDVPTGFALGFLVAWAIPETGASPLRHPALTTDRKRRRVAATYASGSLAFAAFACMGGSWLWLFWPALSLGLVALNYAATGARGFQKREDGRLSVAALALYAPYTLGAWLNPQIMARRFPRSAEVADGVSIGRIHSTREIASSGFAAVVDLTAELPRPADAKLWYRNIPVLDLIVATPEELAAAADAIEEGRTRGTVLVSCALGVSRSAAAVVAWLLRTGRAPNVDAAIAMVRQARPAVALRTEHSAALEALA